MLVKVLTMPNWIDQLEMMKVVDRTIFHHQSALRNCVVEILIEQSSKKLVVAVTIGAAIKPRQLRGRHSHRINKKSDRRRVLAHQRIRKNSKHRIRTACFCKSSKPFSTVRVVCISQAIILGKTIENCDGVVSKANVRNVSPLALYRSTLFFDLSLNGEPRRCRGEKGDQASHDISSKTKPLARRRRPRCAPNRPGDAEPRDYRPYQQKTNGAGCARVAFKVHADNCAQIGTREQAEI